MNGAAHLGPFYLYSMAANKIYVVTVKYHAQHFTNSTGSMTLLEKVNFLWMNTSEELTVKKGSYVFSEGGHTVWNKERKVMYDKTIHKSGFSCHLDCHTNLDRRNLTSVHTTTRAMYWTLFFA